VVAGRLPVHWCGAAGLISLALSNAVLMLNLWASSAILFGSGVLLTAIGHGMCMLAGMSMVNILATPSNRSGMFATYLVIGYIGSVAPMMGMGWVADYWGMNVAVRIFCTLVIVTGAPVALFFLRHPRMQPSL